MQWRHLHGNQTLLFPVVEDMLRAVLQEPSTEKILHGNFLVTTDKSLLLNSFYCSCTEYQGELRSFTTPKIMIMKAAFHWDLDIKP